MFKHIIDENLDLRLLEVSHAEQLFLLVDSSRQYLRRWLPWVDYTKGVIRDAEWICDHYLNHIVYGLLAREWKLSE